MTHRIKKITIVSFIFCCPLLACENLPATETAFKNTVDHWGLAFSDQLNMLNKNLKKFAIQHNIKSPDYYIGTESALRKIFKNKYWFKGKVCNTIELTAGRNESQAFQIAVVPKTGFALKNVKISASALRKTDGKTEIPQQSIKLYRVDFVETTAPQYPVQHVGQWPDMLSELKPFSLDKTDLGLIWYEIKTPKDIPVGDYTGRITITTDNSHNAELTVKLHIWNFTLPDRISLPTMVWINGDIASKEYQDVCEIFLKHHLDPISGVSKLSDFETLKKNLDFCIKQGQTRFQTPKFDNPEEFKEYYEYIKQQGLLDKALIYAACDEPNEKQLKKIVIPKTTQIHNEFPGLKVFMASQYHKNLDKGTDIWLTDLSTTFNSWLKAGKPGRQTLWWYFCGIPIRVNMEKPIADAPRMLIDRDAIEHRIVYWMAHYYNVQGTFIWAGNCTWPDGTTLTTDKLIFPYAGIQNGDGFLIYPGPKPSIRLKVIRDGIEDYWYLKKIAELAKSKKYHAEAQKLLDDIVPTLFVDTHYFNRNPESLLEYRKKLGDLLDRALH